VPLIVLPQSCSCRCGPCPPPPSLIWVCLFSFFLLGGTHSTRLWRRGELELLRIVGLPRGMVEFGASGLTHPAQPERGERKKKTATSREGPGGMAQLGKKEK